MTGHTKTLTVTYGAYSCSLEGFDNALDAVAVVTGFFQDLTAHDPHFGANPLQPELSGSIPHGPAGPGGGSRRVASDSHHVSPPDSNSAPTQPSAPHTGATAAPQTPPAPPSLSERLGRLQSARLEAARAKPADPDAPAQPEGDDFFETGALSVAEPKSADKALNAASDDLVTTGAVAAPQVPQSGPPTPDQISTAAQTVIKTTTISAPQIITEESPAAENQGAPQALLANLSEASELAPVTALSVPHRVSPGSPTGPDPLVSAPAAPQTDAAAAKTPPLRPTPKARAAEVDVTRLMQQSAREMDDPAASRRRASMAHMRTAALTRRAQKHASDADEPTSDHPFREDLNHSLSQLAGKTPPSPLRLVQSQRIDQAEPLPLATTSERSAPASKAANDGQITAWPAIGRPITERILAAFAAVQEHTDPPEVTRAGLLGVFRQTDGADFDREDLLRGFGRLLRAGAIEKTPHGSYRLPTPAQDAKARA